MPSPGYENILNSLATTSFTPEGTATPIYFNPAADTIKKIASALDAGWTSSYPATPTTMVTAFTAEFAGFFTLEGALGQNFIMALAQGIDTDIALWVASYVPPPGSGTHTYIVTAITINAQIALLSPLISNGSTALINSISDIFGNNFGQEVG